MWAASTIESEAVGIYPGGDLDEEPAEVTARAQRNARAL